MEGHKQHVYRTTIDTSGRIVIPAELRTRHHLVSGDTVVVFDDQNGIRMHSIEQAVAEAQKFFCNAIPADVSLVDELISERRDEAARE